MTPPLPDQARARACGARLLISALLVAALGGCTLPGSGGSPSSGQWETSTINGAWIGDPPPFPEQIDRWELSSSWSSSTRAFTDSWTAPGGLDNQTFPATMNGCDQAKTLIRWRASTSGDGEVSGSWRDTSGTPDATGDIVTGRAGWMVIDGCQTPVLKYVGAAGDTLTDVAVSVQQYRPAV